MWVFLLQKYGKFWSVSLEHQVERQPLISEEWNVDDKSWICYIFFSILFFSGEVILIMRHFETGLRIHAYDVSRKGRVLYTFDLDDPQLNLMKIPGYISIDIDGNFLCAADPR